MLENRNNKLVFTYDAETVVIEAWGKDSLRIRAWKQKEMPAEDWALLPVQENNESEVRLKKWSGEITNGNIRAVVNCHGAITFKNQSGNILLEEYVRSCKNVNNVPGIVEREFTSALEIEGREFKPILCGDYALTARFESNPEEKIYGMGQYQQPFLNCKGCEFELAHRNSQSSVPFLVSSLGYGFLWNNPAIGRASFNKNVTTWTAEATKGLDYWITAGDQPAQILRNYAAVTGKVPMMPEWAMGFWQCKLRYQTQEELLEVAREYKRRGVPLSVIVIDFFHWTKQGEWKFDPEYWPDPQAMVSELEEMGVKLMVSIWPTVDHNCENYKEMEERGYLIRTDRGHRIAMTYHGNTIHYDATNPEARKYLWKKVKENYGSYGIDLFWLDEAEPEYRYYDYDLYRYYLGPDVQVGNIYPVMYAKTFYDGLANEGKKDILNLLRCAWAGSQRYGALVWSGDIDSSFKSMRSQFAAGLNMAMAGIPWWTTDIGGFEGGNPSDPDFRECFTRWFQYGTFCPVMRLHGDREPHSKPLGKTGGGVCSSGGPNEIWSYGEEIYDICKEYIAIRERIRPYIASLMEKAHQAGDPPMRPMFYDFPNDKICWETEDEYMFGPHLLVAPVMAHGQRQRRVYLPIGRSWVNAWTGEKTEGGTWLEVNAPIEQIPLFVVAGDKSGSVENISIWQYL